MSSTFRAQVTPEWTLAFTDEGGYGDGCHVRMPRWSVATGRGQWRVWWRWGDFPDWVAYRKKSAEAGNVQHQECKIIKSTKF